jgi:hypothetical protein
MITQYTIGASLFTDPLYRHPVPRYADYTSDRHGMQI